MSDKKMAILLHEISLPALFGPKFEVSRLKGAVHTVSIYNRVYPLKIYQAPHSSGMRIKAHGMRVREESVPAVPLLGSFPNATRIGIQSAMSVAEYPTIKGRLVFISHSGPDTWVAKQIAREIEARGATPFLDEAQVDAGADFEEDILKFLERAHELVVLLTPWALERPYVWAEIGAAWGRRIPIVALLLGLTPIELQTRPGIPVLLKKRDLLQLNEVDIYLEQLAARMRQQQG
jgi:hypothetical protein